MQNSQAAAAGALSMPVFGSCSVWPLASTPGTGVAENAKLFAPRLFPAFSAPLRVMICGSLYLAGAVLQGNG